MPSDTADAVEDRMALLETLRRFKPSQVLSRFLSLRSRLITWPCNPRLHHYFLMMITMIPLLTSLLPSFLSSVQGGKQEGAGGISQCTGRPLQRRHPQSGSDIRLTRSAQGVSEGAREGVTSTIGTAFDPQRLFLEYIKSSPLMLIAPRIISMWQ